MTAILPDSHRPDFLAALGMTIVNPINDQRTTTNESAENDQI
ncbi:MAG TPA: hypothetical protein VGF40_04105 [Thermoanaerobaculia bacterium]